MHARSGIFCSLVLLAMLALSCSDPVEPYVHVPRFEKNISTLFGFEKKPINEDVTPDFSWKDSNGVLRSLKDLHGKVVVLNFWATWCAPCLAETPALRDIAADFKSDSVVVIGVAIDQSGDIYSKVEEFHRTKHLAYQVVMDPGLDVYKAYTGTDQKSIPLTYVLDQDGALYTILVGEQQYDTFAEKIRDLLP